MSFKNFTVTFLVLFGILLASYGIRGCAENKKIRDENNRKIINDLPVDWQRVYIILERTYADSRPEVFKRLQKEYRLTNDLSADQIRVVLDLFQSSQIPEITDFFMLEK